ncbi:MAG: hypothetical protein DCC58_09140 [Chloroflexi bacterium]|nr:MAG: hypothetical protein DCC58_09140 [Chloroflexota bacterium]
MSTTIECPHCSGQVAVTDRFCPYCGSPRTSVRLELEQAAATTGIPYERLLAQARVAGQRLPASIDAPDQSRQPVMVATQPEVTSLALPALLMLASAVLVVVGSIGPWATIFLGSISGLDGDGRLTFFLGIVAGIVALLRIAQPTRRRALAWLAAGVFTVAAVISIYDWSNLQQVADSSSIAIIRVGWGLQLTAIAAVAGALVAFVAAVRRV